MKYLVIPYVDPNNANKIDTVICCASLEGTHKTHSIRDVVNIGLDLVRCEVSLEIPQV